MERQKQLNKLEGKEAEDLADWVRFPHSLEYDVDGCDDDLDNTVAREDVACEVPQSPETSSSAFDFFLAEIQIINLSEEFLPNVVEHMYLRGEPVDVVLEHLNF